MTPAIRRRAVPIAVALAAMLMLLAPALWNGFPLLQYDSGGYFARWYEGTLEESRSTVYGLFVTALARPNFWPVIVVQAAATVWIIALVLRVHRLAQPFVLLVTIAVLSVTTTLPWLAGIVLTDIFFGLSVLALHLLVLRNDALANWERAALIVFIAFSAATHNATLAVLLALLAAGLLVALLNRSLVPLAGLARGAAALVLGAVMLVGANYVVAKRLAWTPGGIGLMFGRMLQDGIVMRYLDEHCPDARLRLCDHRAELPIDSDEFFWGEGLFDRLGRFQGLNDEMRTIVLESLRAYPWLQLETAVVATLRQLVMVRTGWGVLELDLAHPRHDREFRTRHAARHEGGAAAEGRARFYRHQPAACAGRARLNAAAARRDPFRLSAPAFRRPRAACHQRGFGNPRQRLRHRRAVGPARPLRRTRGLDRHVGGDDGGLASLQRSR